MTSTALSSTRAETVTTRQRVGLVLGGLYSLANVTSVLFPTDAGTTGPPFAILVVDTVLGLIGVGACLWAWRGNRVALRAGAGAIILITLSALPAFFVDVSMAVKVLVALSVVLTVVIVVLMFSGDRRPAPVVD